MEALLCAIGFFLIIEGLFPFIAPDKWKEALKSVQKIPNANIRKVALVSVVLGLALVWYTKIM
ncbi:MAG: DUF2065 domain-containing protein [Burkholderiaceae bacterium]|nr:DUF2065 domain-containing protein [Burkholderiaceae bacterium]